MLERKVYSGWAYTTDEDEKAKINKEIYEEIKHKAVVKVVKCGYSQHEYKIVDNPSNLSILELALICDEGNLCFGHDVDGANIIIYVD